MPKSFLYVPGLAMPDYVARQAKSQGDFSCKIESAFRNDNYMMDMVATILAKKAIAADCRQSLTWLCIPPAPSKPSHRKPSHRRSSAMATLPDPRKPSMKKAFDLLGTPSSNVLALEPGKQPTPMRMTVGITLTPCNAPQYLAQPMPSSAKTKALAAIAKGNTLYIVGHSNALGGTLTYKLPALGHIIKDDRNPNGCDGWQHAEKRHIDPVTLGSLLINEGLPPKLKFDIALVACFSGGLEDSDLQTVQSYAQRLAGTLSGRGYWCRVYGATGLTSSKNSQVRVAKGATKQQDGTILLDAMSRETLTDTPDQPFYRRFFRFHRG